MLGDCVILGVRPPRNTMKPRLRYSLRTLLLIPVAIGLFFAIGQITRSYGTPQMKEWMKENRNGRHVHYERPLLFSLATLRPKSPNVVQTKEQYFLWLFGTVLELPFERHFTDTIGPENSMMEIAERRLVKK